MPVTLYDLWNCSNCDGIRQPTLFLRTYKGMSPIARKRLKCPVRMLNRCRSRSPAQPDALLESRRLAYSIAESAQLLGVHYFSVYRMIQRGKLRVCRVLRGKLLVPRSELLKLLNTE